MADASHSKRCIRSVFARYILDSRGLPTVEVDLITDLGLFRASVPSGASVGANEAVELRDGVGDVFLGQGVSKAVDNVNNVIGPELVKAGFDVTQQTEIDEFLIKLDGTDNKSKLGANAILGVSIAVCKAGAAKRGLPLYRHIADLAGNKNLILPVPAFNVINGGVHAGNKLAIQEFMILPIGANSFQEALRMGSEIYKTLGNLLKAKYGTTVGGVGDEGGYCPPCKDAKDALNFLKNAIAKAGYTGRVSIGIDMAATSMYKKGLYDLDFKNKKSNKKNWMKVDKLTNLYKGWVKNNNVISIEDPYHEEQFKDFTNLTKQVDIQIVGDDLLTTNCKRIQKAVDEKACNCLLLKLNQIGSVTEGIKAFLLAKNSGWGVMVSHRSGETEDTFIADLVVGLSAGQIKSGAPCRSERCSKYNQIMRIEEELGLNARFAGRAFRRPQ